jgi:protein-S-isoprenylcysteine O-methyltransferase Ste14
MRATRFEFERRFWIICGIYVVGFSLSQFDHVRAVTALRHLITPSLPPDSAQAIMFARLVIAAGALLVFLTAALRTWGAAYLRTEIVHDTSQHSEALVADGPFRHVRNPLYFANLPMAAGIGVLASRSGWIFLVLANWVFVYRLIFREEEALRESQGEPYRAYLKAVPRFWPSPWPRVRAGNRSAQWGSGVCGGKLCLALWLGGVVDRRDFELKTCRHRVPPGICSSFYRHPSCRKTCEKGARAVEELRR